jgi:hypothetical protein
VLLLAASGTIGLSGPLSGARLASLRSAALVASWISPSPASWPTEDRTRMGERQAAQLAATTAAAPHTCRRVAPLKIALVFMPEHPS